MLLIVSATGAFGFLFSFLMLHLGVSSMAVRYPTAVVLAYVVFLLLVRLWLSYQTSRGSADLEYTAGDAAGDALTFAPDFPSGLGSRNAPGVGVGDAADAFDLDGCALLLVAIAAAAVCAVLLVCVYVIWTGPLLLAEVLVDGYIMARVYRRLRADELPYWLPGVVRRTWLPVTLVVLFFALAGFALQTAAPDAESIGPALEHVLGGR